MANRWYESDEEAERRRSSALMGLIVILSLAIIGIVLLRGLAEKSRLEDCLLAGRNNCAPIILPPR